MNFRRRGRDRRMVILRLPLVAFIDVVLFMLLYFVVAADLTPSEAYLSTALKTDARGKGQGTSLLPQIVRVESDGANVRYKIGDRVLADRASLLALLRQLPKEAGIVVRVSNEVPVSAAATAVAAGREAGFTRISYVPAR